jgi:selenocysteine lyase/cysteine desulfurase
LISEAILADTAQKHTAAINCLADLEAEFGVPSADQYPEFEGRRLNLKTAMAAIRAYELPLAERLIPGLMKIPGVTVYGITDPARDARSVYERFPRKKRSV